MLKNNKINKTNVGADASVCPNAIKAYNNCRGTVHRAQEPAAITLVALIITIIILIILAGVSLNLALGQNGIFQKSKQAVNKYKDESQKEQDTLENIYQDMLAETGGGAGGTGKEPYLPNGFTEVKDETSDGSYIIKDTSGNEFVWIPVETPILDLSSEYEKLSDTYIKNKVKEQIAEGKYPMAIKTGTQTDTEEDTEDDTSGSTDGNYIGVLYQFSLNEDENGVKIEPNSEWEPKSNSSGYREPDTVTGYDGTNEDTVKITQANLQKEYNELVESVIANGGFYIGRYESSVNGTKAASKKNQTPMAHITWYDMYTRQKNIYTENPETKTYMIWGSEWDQVMIYLKDVPNEKATSEKKFFILDSTNMGNNSRSKVNTGSNDSYQVKGIYDLAGNVFDWTVEADDTYNRVWRGGSYGYSASDYPASVRGHFYPTLSYNDLGSRLTLYK